MMQALLPALVAGALAASPAFAADEPVVILPHFETKSLDEFSSYWHQWAQDFSRELTSELGALYSPRMASKVVTGAPYTADVVTETKQMLPDGNDISRRKTGVVYRDNEGRTRQETGPEGKERTVFINDPVAKTHYVLSPGSRRAVNVAPRAMSYKYDTRDKQVVRLGESEIRVEDGKVFIDGKQVQGGGRVEVKRNGKEIVIDNNNITIDGKPLGEAGGSRHVIVRSVETSDGKTHEEVNVQVTPVPPAPPIPPVPAPAPKAGRAPTAIPAPPAPPALPGINTMRFESTAKLGKGITTSLGTKDFEGVKAEGKSTTWTIPAGEIGNRNPITVMSESWYSPDLQVTVYSRHSDPRTGESIYRLANIRRGEPAADLFKVPEEYKSKGRAPKAPQG